MLPAGPSRSDGYHLSSGTATPRSIPSELHDHLSREDILVSADPPPQARGTGTRIWPSAARVFLQRTLARLLRQPKFCNAPTTSPSRLPPSSEESRRSVLWIPAQMIRLRPLSLCLNLDLDL